jgi:hypothetical protein
MHNILKLIKYLTATWMLGLSLFFMYHYDGILFPVVDAQQTKLENMRPEFSATTMTTVDGYFVKTRDCVFTDLKWYYGNQERSVSVIVEFTGKPVIRPIGDYKFKDWRIYLDADNIRHNSYAYAYHDCYNGWLWTTKSLFYMSKPE